MADAMLGVVAEKLLSSIENEFATLSGLRKKAEKLSKTLKLVTAVLEDAEWRQMTDQGSAMKLWLQDLKDAAYVLEDILEDCSSETLQHGCISSFKPKNIMFRYRVGHKLKDMMERLNQIDQERKRFGLSKGVVKERLSEVVAEWRETSSNLASPQVYGREEDKKKVVDFLLSPERCSDDFLSVYAIVGLGGLGKTTLAQMIFNDQKVSSHFDLQIWVCVSENFTKKRIMCSIIECVTKAEWKVSNLDVMEQKVQELLQSKRYLLVLDDVWKKSQKMESGVTQEKWEELRSVLSCGSKGSSILVSTRDMDVAEIMRPCQAHHLSGLSEDDCWSLFKQRAFGPDKEERAELVAIGKEIAKKCRGSPLAAKALGGLMRNRREEKEWLEVKESELWTLPDENDILPALRLSYFHLTPTSKQCFAFCAIFPQDEEIMKQDLIHLWMANGFISSRKNFAVEEVGNMIWNELCQISFFQDVRINDLGVVRFKMHDLVHDLAQSITERECIYFKDLKDIDPAALHRNTHHICFCFGDERILNKKACDKSESLRTLFQLFMYGQGISSWQLPTSLRVLRTSSFNLSLLGNLTHLRYLELNQLKIKAIPDSIYNLCKLEILKLTGLEELGSLPKHLTRLQNLRHLVIERCRSLSNIFPYVNKLAHLRTLSVYFVETEAGHSLTELRDLDLGGKLSIKGLGNVGSSSEAREANLKGKKDLRELILSWENDDKTNSDATDETNQLLEALQPNQNLKALTIREYEGSHWPSWMRNNLVLNKLVSLDLVCCCRISQQFTSLGKLLSLKNLRIHRLDCVQYVDGDECYDGVEVRAFPSLESLKLQGLPKLERLLKVEKEDMFPRLSHLIVEDCPKLQLSFLPSVNNLQVWGRNDELLKSISCLGSLDSLTLNDSEDTSLPEGMMDNLTNLKTLQISLFKRLKELPYAITKLRALESLNIQLCNELECFPDQALEGLRSLRTLSIHSCRGFRSLPDGVQHLTSLEALSIKFCDKLESFPEQGLEGLRSLRTLSIYSCRGLRSLPDGVQHLTSLEALSISYCNKLECFPDQALEGLRSLRTLKIYGCRGMRSLPDGVQHLTSLEALSIYDCVKLECFPDQALEGLRSLRTLEIDRCRGLRSLPDGVQHLTSLEALSIYHCDKLECFPEQGLDGLRSLRTLQILNCGGLRSLPDGVQHLTSLEALTIFGCPALQKRYKKGTGEDWHKIEHIPKYVDGDECYDGVEVRAFPSLESLTVVRLPMLEQLLKVEKEDMFPRLSELCVEYCPKLQLSFLPCVKNLFVKGCNNELLKSISCLSSLDSLTLCDSEDISLPEGMMDNLTNLKTLNISQFRRWNELPYEITKLSALESLDIRFCEELESFPEQAREGLRSLRTLEISFCGGLRSLPDGVQHLTSLEALYISYCDKLECFQDQGLEVYAPFELCTFQVVEG